MSSSSLHTDHVLLEQNGQSSQRKGLTRGRVLDLRRQFYTKQSSQKSQVYWNATPIEDISITLPGMTLWTHRLSMSTGWEEQVRKSSCLREPKDVQRPTTDFIVSIAASCMSKALLWVYLQKTLAMNLLTQCTSFPPLQTIPHLQFSPCL